MRNSSRDKKNTKSSSDKNNKPTTPNKSSQNKKKADPQNRLGQQELKAFFSANFGKSYTAKQLGKKIGLHGDKQRLMLEMALKKLSSEGVLSILQDGSYQYAGSSEFIEGRVDYVNARFAFIICDGRTDDIWVSTPNLHGAMDGDTVRVLEHKKINFKTNASEKSGKPEGEVVQIIERKRTQYVGRIEIAARFAFVIADHRKMFADIFVPMNAIAGAKDGEKVVVKIKDWPNATNKNPVGEVIEILGNAGEHEVEMHSIMAEFGLPMKFPEEVLKESEAVAEKISKEEITTRRDFRKITTFTIDPVDAKDFDDALSIQKLPNGNWEIGVHIADVTHYVKPGSNLEKEAFKRATSVYLVDRVVPMLPEKLSNNICSLRPNEDRLTFSAVFELDDKAKIHSEWYGRTIIHSHRRFAYEEVQEIIETQKGEYLEEIQKLNELAHIMRKDRFKKGAIGFETLEVRFKLDEKGKPLAVVPKIRKDAHKLIEDFMLLANRKVAEFITNMKKGKEKNTFVYRIHDHPNIDKLNSLSIFAKKFGHDIRLEEEAKVAKELNKLIEEVEGKPEQNVLQSLAIRCMAKAVYSTEPEIHFGLAYKHYTHFTSPIRRYPDMMSHRLLEHYLQGGASENKTYYQDKCKHASEMEKIAADAERASIKYKQVEFMKLMPFGKEFEGIISGVIEHGFFVEIIETKCEGMVRLSDLDDDYYVSDLENYRIIGKKNKRMYTLGDKVIVNVLKTDLERRTIDLSFIRRAT
ncbi:MAG: ribonuclease R [Cytophagales bacterium]|nr:MAG: ribonuclease R [Cytophagales bacterium]